VIAAIAHISLPKIGERVNGDAIAICNGPDDRMLLAVIDGLGHGPIAAEASNAAVTLLKAASLDQPVLTLMQSVHAALRGTRGAAATLCLLHGRKIEVCAVGNVQLTSTVSSVPLVLSAGVLGMRVPKFRVCQTELKKGTRLALYSDGISTRFRAEETQALSPEAACKQIIERHRKKEDDATILIADLDG
jgi:negative regulator of sigma-B (phosphoserine phosphatase)